MCSTTIYDTLQIGNARWRIPRWYIKWYLMVHWSVVSDLDIMGLRKVGIQGQRKNGVGKWSAREVEWNWWIDRSQSFLYSILLLQQHEHRTGTPPGFVTWCGGQCVTSLSCKCMTFRHAHWASEASSSEWWRACLCKLPGSLEKAQKNKMQTHWGPVKQTALRNLIHSSVTTQEKQ